MKRELDDADPDWWAWILVNKAVLDEPETAWEMLKRIVDSAQNDRELAAIAAGHLEEFLLNYGAQYLEAVGAQAEHSDAFRKALSGVWLDEADPELKIEVFSLLSPPYLPAFSPEHWGKK